MAIEYFGFFDSTQEDARVYTGADMERYTNVLCLSGVRNAQSLAVETADDGLTVRVGCGSAMVGGHYYALEDDGGGAAVRTLEAPVSKSRVDRIILRMNGADTARNISLCVLKGTESDEPQPPSLTREGAVYEISLARITLSVGASVITQDQIVDERADSAVCGVLQGVTAQQALERAEEVMTLAQTMQTQMETLDFETQTAVNNAFSAKETANRALNMASGAHYWMIGPTGFLVGQTGWTYDSDYDRYYLDVAMPGMTSEILPVVLCSAVGGKFPLCGCQSLPSALRLFLTDLPTINATLSVYGLGVKG